MTFSPFKMVSILTVWLLICVTSIETKKYTKKQKPVHSGPYYDSISKYYPFAEHYQRQINADENHAVSPSPDYQQQMQSSPTAVRARRLEMNKIEIPQMCPVFKKLTPGKLGAVVGTWVSQVAATNTITLEGTLTGIFVGDKVLYRTGGGEASSPLVDNGDYRITSIVGQKITLATMTGATVNLNYHPDAVGMFLDPVIEYDYAVSSHRRPWPMYEMFLSGSSGSFNDWAVGQTLTYDAGGGEVISPLEDGQKYNIRTLDSQFDSYMIGESVVSKAKIGLETMAGNPIEFNYYKPVVGHRVDWVIKPDHTPKKILPPWLSDDNVLSISMYSSSVQLQQQSEIVQIDAREHKNMLISLHVGDTLTYNAGGGTVDSPLVDGDNYKITTISEMGLVCLGSNCNIGNYLAYSRSFGLETMEGVAIEFDYVAAEVGKFEKTDTTSITLQGALTGWEVGTVVVYNKNNGGTYFDRHTETAQVETALTEGTSYKIRTIAGNVVTLETLDGDAVTLDYNLPLYAAECTSELEWKRRHNGNRECSHCGHAVVVKNWMSCIGAKSSSSWDSPIYSRIPFGENWKVNDSVKYMKPDSTNGSGIGTLVVGEYYRITNMFLHPYIKPLKGFEYIGGNCGGCERSDWNIITRASVSIENSNGITAPLRIENSNGNWRKPSTHFLFRHKIGVHPDDASTLTKLQIGTKGTDAATFTKAQVGTKGSDLSSFTREETGTLGTTASTIAKMHLCAWHSKLQTCYETAKLTQDGTYMNLLTEDCSLRPPLLIADPNNPDAEATVAQQKTNNLINAAYDIASGESLRIQGMGYNIWTITLKSLTGITEKAGVQIQQGDVIGKLEVGYVNEYTLTISEKEIYKSAGVAILQNNGATLGTLKNSLTGNSGVIVILCNSGIVFDADTNLIIDPQGTSSTIVASDITGVEHSGGTTSIQIKSKVGQPITLDKEIVLNPLSPSRSTIAASNLQDAVDVAVPVVLDRGAEKLIPSDGTEFKMRHFIISGSGELVLVNLKLINGASGKMFGTTYCQDCKTHLCNTQEDNCDEKCKTQFAGSSIFLNSASAHLIMIGTTAYGLTGWHSSISMGNDRRGCASPQKGSTIYVCYIGEYGRCYWYPSLYSTVTNIDCGAVLSDALSSIQSFKQKCQLAAGETAGGYYVSNAPEMTSSTNSVINRHQGGTGNYQSYSWKNYYGDFASFGRDPVSTCDAKMLEYCRKYAKRVECKINSASEATQPVYCAGKCMKGTYGLDANNPESFSICTMCPKGWYQESDGQPTCVACIAGKYLEIEASFNETDCKSCVRGSNSLIVGSSSENNCEGCESGKYIKYDENGDLSKDTCIICASGQYNTQGTNTKCMECPFDTFLQDDGEAAIAHDDSDDCVRCELVKKGSFAEPGSAMCGMCVAGKRTVKDLFTTITTCVECSEGTYQEQSAQSECKLCPTGFFINVVSSRYCLPCVPGKHQSSNGTMECIDCDPETFSVVESQAECIGCPIGYTATTSGSTLCTLCDAGMYGLVNDGCHACAEGRYRTGTSENDDPSKCALCPAGFAQKETGQAACFPCVPGTYQTLEEQTSCEVCEINTFASTTGLAICENCTFGSVTGGYKGSAGCQACIPGRFVSGEATAATCKDCITGRSRSIDNNPGACVFCQGGFYQSEGGQTQCFPCVPGRFRFEAEATSCIECEKDWYADKIGMKACTQCVVGAFTSGKGSAICSDCDAGKYGRGCEDCEVGTKRATSDLPTVCKECQGGFYQDKKAQTQCLPCVPGRAQHRTKQTECQLCDKNKYSDKTELIRCVDCPIGSWTLGKGGASCQECDAGTAARDQYSSGAGCDPCSSGKYRGTDTSPDVCLSCDVGRYQDQTGQTTCLPCVPGTAQNLPGQASCQLCPLHTIVEDIEAESCESCEDGEFTLNIGGAMCFKCMGGRYGGVLFSKSKETTPIGESLECDRCSTGTYRGSNDKASNCSSCIAGQYQHKNGTTECFDCLPGTFQDTAGAANCMVCPSGWYRPGTDDNTLRCLQCNVGEWTAEKNGQTLCEPCDVGAYANSPGNCSACVVGLYTDEKGTVESCKGCLDGEVNQPERSSCSLCDLGKYATGQGTCSNCPQGLYQDDRGKPKPGQPLCKECDGGEVSEGASACNLCDLGRYYLGKGKCGDCGTDYTLTINPFEVTNMTEVKVGVTVTQGASIAVLQTPLFAGSATTIDLFSLNGYANEFMLGVDLIIDIDGVSSTVLAEDIQRVDRYGNYADFRGQYECLRCYGGKLPNMNHTMCVFPPWFVTANCKVYYYLDDGDSDRMRHRCRLCPEGAVCNTDIGIQKRSTGLDQYEEFWRVPKDYFPKYTEEPYMWEPFMMCPNQGECGSALHNESTPCLHHTTGTLCAICEDGYFRRSGGCVPCSAGEAGKTIVAASVAGIIAYILFKKLWRKVADFKRKYGETWRDIMRIGTVAFNYSQISSSLPNVIIIRWPPIYLQFLEILGFVNINIIQIAGFGCVPGVDYRQNVLLTCGFPVIIVLVSIIAYSNHKSYLTDLSRKSNKRKKKKWTRVSITTAAKLFDLADIDGNLSLDTDEFIASLLEVKREKGRSIKNIPRKNVQRIMLDLAEHHTDDKSSSLEAKARKKRARMLRDRNEESGGEAVVVLERRDFLRAARDDDPGLKDLLGKHWVLLSAKRQAKSTYSAVMLIALFLIHAPVSMRLMMFFSCIQVGGRQFLSEDYRIECNVGVHSDFKTFAYGGIILFTIGLPFTLLFRLYVHRNELYKPHVREFYGFLYAPFTRGAEFWEIHELLRKLFLTGFIVFIPTVVGRIAACIYVSVTAATSLAYFIPHKNKIVFRVASISYYMSTSKYLVACLVLFSRDGEYKLDSTMLGFFLIVADGMFLGSAIASGVYIMWKKIEDIKEQEQTAEVRMKAEVVATKKIQSKYERKKSRIIKRKLKADDDIVKKKAASKKKKLLKRKAVRKKQRDDIRQEREERKEERASIRKENAKRRYKKMRGGSGSGSGTKLDKKKKKKGKKSVSASPLRKKGKLKGKGTGEGGKGKGKGARSKSHGKMKRRMSMQVAQKAIDRDKVEKLTEAQQAHQEAAKQRVEKRQSESNNRTQKRLERRRTKNKMPNMAKAGVSTVSSVLTLILVMVLFCLVPVSADADWPDCPAFKIKNTIIDAPHVCAWHEDDSICHEPIETVSGGIFFNKVSEDCNTAKYGIEQLLPAYVIEAGQSLRIKGIGKSEWDFQLTEKMALNVEAETPVHQTYTLNGEEKTVEGTLVTELKNIVKLTLSPSEIAFAEGTKVKQGTNTGIIADIGYILWTVVIDPIALSIEKGMRVEQSVNWGKACRAECTWSKATNNKKKQIYFGFSGNDPVCKCLLPTHITKYHSGNRFKCEGNSFKCGRGPSWGSAYLYSDHCYDTCKWRATTPISKGTLHFAHKGESMTEIVIRSDHTTNFTMPTEEDHYIRVYKNAGTSFHTIAYTQVKSITSVVFVSIQSDSTYIFTTDEKIVYDHESVKPIDIEADSIQAAHHCGGATTLLVEAEDGEIFNTDYDLVIDPNGDATITIEADKLDSVAEYSLPVTLDRGSPKSSGVTQSGATLFDAKPFSTLVLVNIKLKGGVRGKCENLICSCKIDSFGVQEPCGRSTVSSSNLVWDMHPIFYDMYYAGGAIYGVWDANIILIGVHFGDNIGWHGKLGNKGNVFVQRKPSDTIKPSREEYRSSFIPTFKTKFFMMNAPDDLSSRAFGITRSLGQWTTDVATNKYLSPDDVWLPLNPISTYGLNSLNYCDDLAFASCRTFMGRSQCFKDKYPNEAAIISGGMAGSVQPTYCAGTCVGGWYGKTVAAATPEDGKIEMCGETRLRGEYCGSQRCPDVIQPCRMCPKGYHTIKNEGNEECDKCPSTYYNDQVGSSECKLCPGGAVSIEGSTDPSDCGVCPAGRYTCGTDLSFTLKFIKFNLNIVTVSKTSVDGETYEPLVGDELRYQETSENQISGLNNGKTYVIKTLETAADIENAFTLQISAEDDTVVTLQPAISTEWMLLIANKPIVNELAGVKVIQGTSIGTLETRLIGTTTSVVIKTAVGVIFVATADVLIGATTVELANIEKVTKKDATTTVTFFKIGNCDEGKSAKGCTICAAGRYNTEGTRNECDACPKNTFLQDPATKHENHDSADDCKPCEDSQPDTFSVPGSQYCTECEAGKRTYIDATDDITKCADCLSGRYQNNVAQTTCVDCPTGYFFDLTGSAYCLPCVPGRIQPNEASRECVLCEKNTYQNVLNEISCKNCPYGYVAEKGQSKCVECKAGRFSSSSGGCQACTTGRYRLGTDLVSTSCRQCPAGFSQKDLGSASCLPCTPGFAQLNNGSSICDDCLVNQYTDDTRQLVCKSCPFGFVTHEKERSAACEECTPGKNYDGTGINAKCLKCQSGSYRFSTDSVGICKLCDPGKYQNKTGQTSCLACMPGQSIGVIGATFCVPCVKDDFANISGLESCKVCPFAKYTPMIGSSQCQFCDAGKYGGRCTKCEVGRYRSAGDSFDACTICEPGMYQHQLGQTSCLPCIPGKAQDETEATECNICPINFISNDTERFVCDYCAFGTYAPKPGMVACRNCEAGRYGDKCTDCSVGMYRASKDSLNSCKKCDLGFYQTEKASVACLPCIPGKAQNTKGSTNCTICRHFEYSDAIEMANCIPCEPGKYTSKLGSSICQTCKLGRAGTYCAKCPKGTYRGAEDDVMQCKDCLIGTYQDRVEQTVCIDCKAGTYQIKIATLNCDNCPFGWYRPSDAAPPNTKCFQCPSGFTTIWNASSSCEMCDRGQYSLESRPGHCIQCETGYFTKSKAHIGTKCLSCDFGEISGLQSLCKLCDLGQYALGKGQCEQCPKGFYQDVKGKIECQMCSGGEITNENTVCQQCALGRHSSLSGLPCVDCEPGRYNALKGREKCSVCFGGKLANSDGTACEWPDYVVAGKCKIGYYLNDTDINKYNHSCQVCPFGSDCTADVGVQVRTLGLNSISNWWRVPPELIPEIDIYDNEMNLIIPWKPYVRCPYDGECNYTVINDNSLLINANTTCLLNTQGILCAVCKPGYLRKQAGCSQCSASEIVLTFITLGFISIGLLIFFYKQRGRILKFRKQFKDAERDVIRLVVSVLNYMQISTSLPTVIDAGWPPLYVQFLEKMGIVNVDVVQMSGFGCTEGVDYRQVILVNCLFPVVILIVAYIYYRCYQDKLFTLSQPTTDAGKIKWNTLKLRIASYVFDLADNDHSGTVDGKEFTQLLLEAQTFKGKEQFGRDLEKKDVQELMQIINETKDNNIQWLNLKALMSDLGEDMTVIEKDNFLRNGVQDSTKLDNMLGDDWLAYSALRKRKAFIFATAMSIVFAVHSPISQRLFLFFGCNQVGYKMFLKEDYRIECHSGPHLEFQSFVYPYMFLFTICFPFGFCYVLFRHRKALSKPSIKIAIGFLYQNYSSTAPFWQIHELLRKLILTGFLLFLPTTSMRASGAIFISAIACGTCNYFKPHINPKVQSVEFLHFYLIAMKYLLALLIVFGGMNMTYLGIGLVSADALFLSFSFLNLLLILKYTKDKIDRAGEELKFQEKAKEYEDHLSKMTSLSKGHLTMQMKLEQRGLETAHLNKDTVVDSDPSSDEPSDVEEKDVFDMSSDEVSSELDGETSSEPEILTSFSEGDDDDGGGGDDGVKKKNRNKLSAELIDFLDTSKIKVTKKLCAAFNTLGFASIDDFEDLDDDMTASLEAAMKPLEVKRFRKVLKKKGNMTKKQVENEEEKCKQQVKQVASTIRLAAIGKVGKENWKKMSWKKKLNTLEADSEDEDNLDAFADSDDEEGDADAEDDLADFADSDDESAGESEITMSVPKQRRKSGFSMSHLNHAVKSKKAESIQQESERQRQLAVDRVKIKKNNADERLQKRLQKRNSSRSAAAISINDLLDEEDAMDGIKKKEKNTDPFQDDIDELRDELAMTVQTPVMLRKIINILDKDHNGELSKQEFLKMMDKLAKQLGIDRNVEQLLDVIWISCNPRKHHSGVVDHATLARWLWEDGCVDPEAVSKKKMKGTMNAALHMKKVRSRKRKKKRKKKTVNIIPLLQVQQFNRLTKKQVQQKGMVAVDPSVLEEFDEDVVVWIKQNKFESCVLLLANELCFSMGEIIELTTEDMDEMGISKAMQQKIVLSLAKKNTNVIDYELNSVKVTGAVEKDMTKTAVNVATEVNKEFVKDSQEKTAGKIKEDDDVDSANIRDWTLYKKTPAKITEKKMTEAAENEKEKEDASEDDDLADFADSSDDEE